MFSTIATAALINFLIVPIAYHDSEPAYTNTLKTAEFASWPHRA